MISYRGIELFKIDKDSAIVGMPEWANLRVRQASRTFDSKALTGPGIYALMLDDALFYVGLYAGTAENPCGGSAWTRWSKHIGSMTLRGRNLSFSPKAMQAILMLTARDDMAGPAGDLRRVLLNALPSVVPGAHDITPEILMSHRKALAPLRERGLLSSMNKLLFASRHWNAFRSDESRAHSVLLERISFLYQRIPMPHGKFVPKSVVKNLWLAPLERVLIQELKPICNSQTTSGAHKEFTRTQVIAAFGRVFDDAELETTHDHSKNSSPVHSSDVLNDGQSVAHSSEEEEVGGLANLFLEGLSDAAAELVISLQEGCGGTEECYFVNISSSAQLRLGDPYDNGTRHKPLLLLTRQKRGKTELRCHTRATIEQCLKIGLDAQRWTDDPNQTLPTRFAVDPRIHTA